MSQFRHIMRIHLSFTVASALLSWAMLVASAAAAPPTTPATVTQFFTQHCVRCHSEKKVEGGLRLDNLAHDFVASAAAWDEIRFRLNNGEMPPQDQPQPTPEQRAEVIQWITARLAEGEAARMAKRERVTHSKLTRDEYAYTVQDLLGITYDPNDPAGLPEDDMIQGFERLGAAQSVSPSHIEKYFAAAETILAEAFPETTPKPFEFVRRGWEMNGGPSQWAQWERQGIRDRVRFLIHPGWSLQHGRAGAGRILTSGDYRFRAKLSGLKPPRALAPHLVVYANELDRVLYEADIVTPEFEPITLEFTAHLPAGMITLKWLNQVPGPSILPTGGRAGNAPFISIAEGREPWQHKMTDDEGTALWPLLILDMIEITGPIESPRNVVARQEFMPTSAEDSAAVRASLTRFVERACRRPVTDSEVAAFVKLFESEVAAGAQPQAAFRSVLQAVLCSQDFLYLVEGDVARSRQELNDYELAARLSYFLWSSLPDDKLLAAGRADKLHDPRERQAQVQRLLADPRSERFVKAFPRQWLQLQQVGKFPPDKKLYPDYDMVLEKSFHDETTAFFGEVLRKNLSLREFVDSDWTMLNARLAQHYGITGVEGEAFRRVALKPDDHRGGLLTQASVLCLTSDGQRHRPVHRGKWVLESILGKSPPPPPANVDAIEPTPSTEPKATIRMKLAAHKTNPNCAACHRSIDPLGFAFDNYDAIGRWRTTEFVSDGRGDNPPVDASGELVDGRKFADAAEFKRLLLADLDQFTYTLVEKLATFGLRRRMTLDDRAELERIVKASQANDYRLGELVTTFVMSDLFTKR